MKKLVTILLLSFLGLNSFAGDNQEFRATWVITWEHIDANSSVAANKARVRKILDDHKQANMNAVLWQARQGGTAYYNSSYEPWGYYAGYANPGYDPLEYAIEEAHKRGLELHAWFNVFAASSTYSGTPAAEHPEWVCRDQDGNAMTESRALSPGLEEVRAYTINVAMELIRNYDIDGFHLDYVRWNEYSNSKYSKLYAKNVEQDKRHLDGMITQDQIDDLQSNLAGRYLYDYLHPYSSGVPQGYSSWEQWWRGSVTEFVRVLHDSIQSVKPWVRLSAAVLGKYNWSGWQGYGTVYQDAALWFNEGSIDQLTPMHYHWTNGPGFYDMLTGNSTESWRPYIQPGIQAGRLYSVGPGSYQFATNNVWGNHPQVVQYCRNVPWVDGFQFFSYGSWEDYNYWEDAKKIFFNTFTKVRATELINNTHPDSPLLELSKLDSLNYLIMVDPPDTLSNNYWYAIYRSEDNNFDVSTDEIIDIHFGKASYQVNDSFTGTQDFSGNYHYFATTLNRYWNESTISNTAQTETIPSFAPTVSSAIPADEDTIAVNGSIIISFSKTMDKNTFANAVTFIPEKSVSQILWTADNKTATILANGDFDYATDHTMTIDATVTDVNGKFLDGNGDGIMGDDFVLHFSTISFDIVGPFIFMSNPDFISPTLDFPIDEVISIVFSEQINSSTINNNTVQLFQNGVLIPSEYKVTLINEKSVLSVQTADPLEVDTEYSLELSDQIADTIGNLLDSDISIPFKTTDLYYSELFEIDNFLSISNWQQPSYSGSTVGIVIPNTIFDISAEAYLPSSSSRQRNSARLRYEWSPSASDYLIRDYASGDAIKAAKFDTSYILQTFIFGDGSNNKFRFCLREANGEGYPLEVSQWLTIDWFGWKIVEWDLSDPNSVGTWLGNEILDGSSYYIDSYQLTHEDGVALTGKIYFDKLRAVKKSTSPTDVVTNDKNRPENFQLFQNYPNPFNPTTTLSFSIPSENHIKLTVYDILGREITTLIDRQLSQGFHKILFDGSYLPSGIYIYRIKYNQREIARQMLLMK